MNKPIFTISLDFELFWGVCDHRTIESYGQNILGVRKAIPAMLELFRKYEIHVTWATVGFLFWGDKTSLLQHLPEQKPSYVKKSLSPYERIKNIGENEKSDPYHFGKSLIEEIQQSPFQEIGSHTFSHYYCLEEGQTIHEFECDSRQAIESAKSLGLELKSIVFPRNQFNQAYLEIINKYGITSYRSNEPSWLYDARNSKDESIIRRSIRLLDSYINISGNHIYDIEQLNKGQKLINIPSSSFLRPYSSRLSLLEPLKLRRIKNAMLAAAQQGKLFHLWWHPHNFGKNLEENIANLNAVLLYYQKLKKEYGMESRTMKEISNLLNESTQQ